MLTSIRGCQYEVDEQCEVEEDT